MTEEDEKQSSGYPRLYGGTFFTLLMTVTREYIQDDESETPVQASTGNVLADLIGVADLNGIVDIPKSYRQISGKYKDCEKDHGAGLPFFESDFYNVFDEGIHNDPHAPMGYWDIVKSMEAFTKACLNVGTRDQMKALVRAVLKLVEEDRSIPDAGFTEDGKAEMFYICPDGNPVNKKDMLRIDKFYLPCFLTGIWHFIIVNRKENTDGADTLEAWKVPSLTNRTEFQKFIFTAAKGYRDVDVVTDLPDEQQEFLDTAGSTLEGAADSADNKKASDPTHDEAEYETIEGDVVNDADSDEKCKGKKAEKIEKNFFKFEITNKTVDVKGDIYGDFHMD